MLLSVIEAMGPFYVQARGIRVGPKRTPIKRDGFSDGHRDIAWALVLIFFVFFLFGPRAKILSHALRGDSWSGTKATQRRGPFKAIIIAPRRETFSQPDGIHEPHRSAWFAGRYLELFARQRSAAVWELLVQPKR